MAAQITHEVRNPLASIGLYAELLGDELGESEEARRLVASIISEVDRLTEITETYLRFARLPRPKLEAEDIGAVVTGVLEFARAELQQAGIALEVQVAPSLPEVAADEAQLRQALLNLVRNAREAMAATGKGQDRDGAAAVGGRLRVSVDGADGAVRIRVEDSGPGIPREDLGKIFEPFFSTKRHGTGLGLALVQQIVAGHGGRVDVESKPGEGTAFVLSIPATPPPAHEIESSPEETSGFSLADRRRALPAGDSS
jgi:signal transduction histidine kinase